MGSITKEEKLRREKLAEQGVKVCSQCKRELPFTHFSKDKTKKDGYRCYCNDCAKEHRKIYYENNQKNNEEYKAERKIYLSNYYKENKDKLDVQHKEYYKENKDVIQKQHKQYAELHKEEIALYKAEYYELNKEQIKDKKHRYYIKNYDHFSEKNKKYRLEHASEIMKYDKQYRSTEHGKIMRKKHKHTRRAIEKNADGQYSSEDVKNLILFFDNKCAYTGEPLEDKYHLDHVVALKNGGTNYIWNIVPCNRNPNLSKGSKDMEQWFRKQEYFSGDRLQKIYEWINTKQKEIGGAKIMDQNIWKKLPSENDEQYIYRICAAKDTNDMTWQNICDILNEALGQNYGESAYRKRYQMFQQGLKACEKQIFTDDEYLKKIKEQTDELYKAKKQFQDQRREYNKLLVSDARADHLTNELIKAANNLNDIKPLENNGECYLETEHEAVLVLTDWHFGMVTDNIWNAYNPSICIGRINKLFNKTKEYLRLNNVDKLHVVLLGDFIAGAIHTGVRVASEENTCDQLMRVSELLASLIWKLSDYVNDVYVYSTYGNHARTVQNKNDSIHSDNMETIIPWWLQQRLSNNNKVRVVYSDVYEFIYFNILGHDIVAVHGDLESFRKLGTDMHTLFNKKLGIDVEYVFSGDKHHSEMIDSYGIDNVMVSSLCGTDEYANNKRLFSKPGQTLCIFNKDDGKVCTYNINF